MEPTPPELGAGTGSPHELVIQGREELLYLLGEAAEVEHAACCIYLYAAFTLRAEPGDGLTAAQVPAVAGWKRGINRIALQEMIHLALVNNLLAALGGAPRLGRHNLPQRSPYAPEIRLTLAPFSEQTLRRFLYIERPEGMDISSIAGELDHDRPAPPVPTGPLVLPAPQAFSSVGQLYRGIEWGLRGLVDRYGQGQVFVGSPNAQASTRYFQVPERMPELIPVTGLASAVQAIETIVEEGEGARGSWQRAHFGRFLEILEAYRAMKAADPFFSPARPSVTNPYVRVPRDLVGLATVSGPAAPDDPRGGPPHPGPDHRRRERPVQRLLRGDAAAAVPLLPAHRGDRRRAEHARRDRGGDDAPGHPAAGGITDQAAGRATGAGVDRRAELHAHQRDPGDPAQAGRLEHPQRTAAGAGRGVRRPDRGRAGGAGRGPPAAGGVRGAAGASWCREPGAASGRPGPGGRSTGWRRRRPEFRAGYPAVVHRAGPGRHALGVRPGGGRVGAAARRVHPGTGRRRPHAVRWRLVGRAGRAVPPMGPGRQPRLTRRLRPEVQPVVGSPAWLRWRRFSSRLSH